jgi:hypothetical protein
MTNTSDNDNKDKNDGVKEKIGQSFASYTSDSLQKIIKLDHWERIQKHWQKLTKLNSFQLLGVIVAVSLLLRFSIGLYWLLFLIAVFVWGYVLWTEQPWAEKSVKNFVIYKHPTGELTAVKQGWSWPSLFGFIWTLIKKMWVLSALLIVLWLLSLLSAAYEHPTEHIFDSIALMSSILIGINGNFWYEKKLLADGFQRIDTVTAKSKKGALAAYLNQVDDKK